MERQRNAIIISLSLSLLIHLLLVLLFFVMSLHSVPEPLKPPSVVEVTIVNRPYQIADIEPPAKEERPEKAKFVGLYDSRVQEERVAPSRRPGGSKKSAAAPVEKKSAKEKREGTRLAAKSPEEKVTLGGEGEDLFGGLPEDFFPDYHVGDHTYLNVLRFPKVGYFVRLKKIFKTTFNPVPSLRASLMTTQVSKGQVEVVLGVTIDRAGRLAELRVLRSSGIPRYDQEAVRTIQDSAPFAVPPAELLNSPTGLRMAWTFTVYL